uniref:Homeobox protein MSH-B n=1 Tax=Phallusia mammillata TaxID=59560 RepID=A0A6F9DCX6_9ASCI|nr:homeobox protein MSH-B [Phallusia mammillata]
MKLNFSIDVILGTCSDAKKTKLPERKRSNREESYSNDFYTTPGNFTVEWKPPYQKRIKTEFENSSTKPSTPEVQHRFPFMPSFIPSAGTTYPTASNLAGQNEQSLGSDFGCNVNVRVSGGVKSSNNQLNNSFSSECHSSSDDSEIESRLGGARLHNSNNSKNSSTDSESKQTSKRGSSRVGRRLFTGFQILELETAFSMKTYLTRTERAYLAQKVNLTECQIKTWFQNRRTKEKRRGPCSDDDVAVSEDVTSSVTYQSKAVRVPGHGIQVRPTYGPPDKHLHAAIMDFLKRKSNEEITVS